MYVFAYIQLLALPRPVRLQRSMTSPIVQLSLSLAVEAPLAIKTVEANAKVAEPVDHVHRSTKRHKKVAEKPRRKLQPLPVIYSMFLMMFAFFSQSQMATKQSLPQ